MLNDNPTAERILDAATALWTEKGFEQATMRELGRRLGMGVSSLYFYFKSKEEIVQFLYAKINRQAVEQFRAADGGEKSLAANFSRYVSTKLVLLQPHKSALVALMKEAVDPGSPLNPLSSASDTTRALNFELFEDLVVRSGMIPKNHTKDVARLLWFLNLAILMYWMHDRTDDYANTKTLLGKAEILVGMLPMVTRMPGADGAFRLISGLLPESSGEQPFATAGEAAEEAIRDVDIVILGGGPIAAIYASFVKMARPTTRLLVLEKQPETGHKIGESTLSGFCKAMRTIGIHQEAMRTLFYPKNGLGFFFVDRKHKDLTAAEEYILETFDETYQVERRVLDALLLANAQRMGIQVVQGASVDIKKSTLSSNGNVISYSIGKREYKARAPLVVDASGPAGLLSREYGLWSSDGLPFQTSATWTYFRDVRPLASYQWPRPSMFPRDQYTQHLCLREGWLWYIPVVSWQQTPVSNLTKGLEACLRAPRSIPDRKELSEEFGCPFEEIVSIGLVLRNDRDRWLKDDVREAFEHYQRKYPAIRQLLQGAKPISDHYGTGQDFMQRLAFRGYSRRISGDGWLLIGDAAFFVDPLISPGLTGGTAVAYRAATASVKALERRRFDREVFADLEAFTHELHDALERDNQLVYMSFNHPQSLALIQRLQEIDARKHFLDNAKAAYSEADTNVWGILSPSYQELQQRAWNIMHDAEHQLADIPLDEQTADDYQPMVGALFQLLEDYLEKNRDLTPYMKSGSSTRAGR